MGLSPPTLIQLTVYNHNTLLSPGWNSGQPSICIPSTESAQPGFILPCLLLPSAVLFLLLPL